MNDALALRHVDTVVRVAETAADAEDEVGLVQEVMDRLRHRAAARAERQGVIFGERALAVQAGRDRRFEQFRQFAQRIPRLRVVHALPGVDDRQRGRKQPIGRALDRLRVGRGAQPLRRMVVDRLGHVFAEQVGWNLDQHRPRPPAAQPRERAAQHIRDGRRERH